MKQSCFIEKIKLANPKLISPKEREMTQINKIRDKIGTLQ